MSDFQEFLLKNLNLLILLAFVFAPMILKALAKSREQAARKKPGEMKRPEVSGQPVEPGKAASSKQGQDLESKIRNFFEELTGESTGPKPKKPPEPVPEMPDEKVLPKPDPDPRFQAGPAPEPTVTGVDTSTPAFTSMPKRPKRKPRPRLEPSVPEPASLMDDIAPVEDPYAVDRSPHEPETPHAPEAPPPVDIPWDQKTKRRHALITKKELSGSNLRKAIILREILDVPVSLR